jgi:hypothetical protein
MARLLARLRRRARLHDRQRGGALRHDRRWVKFSSRSVRYIRPALTPPAQPQPRRLAPLVAPPVRPARLRPLLEPPCVEARLRARHRRPQAREAEVHVPGTPRPLAPNPLKNDHRPVHGRRLLATAVGACDNPNVDRARPRRHEARSATSGPSLSGDRPPASRMRPTRANDAVRHSLAPATAGPPGCRAERRQVRGRATSPAQGGEADRRSHDQASAA